MFRSHTFDHAAIEAFKRTWPCNNIPELSFARFEFDDRNGDLVDVDYADMDGNTGEPSEDAGPALLALSQDAWTAIAEKMEQEERSRVSTWVLAFYEDDRAYGGPEEGGWWYNCGELVRVFRVLRCTEDRAFALVRRGNALLDRLQRGKRDTGSMAYSGGRHSVRAYENTAPSHYPQVTPHYE